MANAFAFIRFLRHTRTSSVSVHFIRAHYAKSAMCAQKCRTTNDVRMEDAHNINAHLLLRSNSNNFSLHFYVRISSSTWSVADSLQGAYTISNSCTTQIKSTQNYVSFSIRNEMNCNALQVVMNFCRFFEGKVFRLSHSLGWWQSFDFRRTDNRNKT